MTVSQSKRKATFGSFLFLGFLISYQLVFSLFISPEGGSRILDRSLLILLILTEVIGTILLYGKPKEKAFARDRKLNGLVNACVLFAIVATVYALLEVAFGDFPRAIELLPTIISVSLSLPATLYYCRNLNFKSVGRFLFWSLFLISGIAFILSLFHLGTGEGFSETAFLRGNNVGYSFVILTPLALFAYRDQKWFGLAILLVLSLFVFFSAKRGAMLTQALMVLLVFVKGPYRFRWYGAIMLLLCGLLAIKPIVSYVESMEVSPLERFSSSGGSGRDLIYSSIWNGITSSSFGELLWGHGFYATKEITGSLFGASSAQAAHNDWLEVMYDFGLIGLISYLLIPIYLLLLTYKLWRRKRAEARVLLLVLALFIVKTNVSMVFADKTSMIYYMTIGLLLLECNYREGTQFGKKLPLSMKTNRISSLG